MKELKDMSYTELLKFERTSPELIDAQMRKELDRLKEKKLYQFIYIMKMMKEQQKSYEEANENPNFIDPTLYKMYMKQSCEENERMLNSVENQAENVNNFFKDPNENPERTEARKQILKAVNIDEEDYGALALTSTVAKDKEKAMDIMKGNGISPKEVEDKIRKEGINNADVAMVELYQGKPEKMENLMREDLKHACYNFAQTNDPEEAMHWAKHVDSLMSIRVQNPELFKSDLDQKLMENALGVASMGKIMENGHKALKELQQAQVEGKKLSHEKEIELQGQIFLMSDVDNKRSSDAYKKGFSKDYIPKKGIPKAKMDEFLKKLTESQAMKSLNSQSTKEKMLRLSNREARNSFCKNMFEKENFTLFKEEVPQRNMQTAKKAMHN